MKGWIGLALLALLTALSVGRFARLIHAARVEQSQRQGVAARRAARARRADRTDKPIHLGAAGPWERVPSQWRGIQLAVAEINAAGGVGGRPLTMRRVDDEADVQRARRVAQALADDPDVVAVVGHTYSAQSLATALTYEYYGVLMLSPISTNPHLTKRGYRLVFRNIPSDTRISAGLADFARKRALRRVLLYYDHDDYGRGLANAFERRAGEVGITVVDRAAYEADQTQEAFARDLARWRRNLRVDAIVLGAHVQEGVRILRALDAIGWEVPVLAGDGLDRRELFAYEGERRIYIGSVYDPELPWPETRAFIAAYRQRYGEVPDTAAAQGYDAIRVLALAMTQAGSTAPPDVARALRSIQGRRGVTGLEHYLPSGDVLKPIVIKTVAAGRFAYFDAIPPEPAPKASKEEEKTGAKEAPAGDAAPPAPTAPMPERLAPSAP